MKLKDNQFIKKILKKCKKNKKINYKSFHFHHPEYNTTLFNFTSLVLLTISFLLIISTNHAFAKQSPSQLNAQYAQTSSEKSKKNESLVKCYHPQACKGFVMRTPEVCRMIGGSLSPLKKKSK